MNGRVSLAPRGGGCFALTPALRAAEHQHLPSEKAATSRRGKPRPADVREAIRAAQRGRPLREETRRKMSAAHRARWTLVPGTRLWTPKEDEAVRTLPRGEAALRTGRPLQAVSDRRRRLGLPDGRRRE